MAVFRIDHNAAQLGKISVTTQGFLRIPATLTRTGVLTYRRADGTAVRELRHPDDVFRADSLQTLSGCPVTIGHKGMIGPENVAQYSTGMVAETIEQKGDFVDGTVVVQRKDAIDKVHSKELVELSPGYTCEIDATPGEYEGERYDQRQTAITYNHLALLAPGKGRSGAKVALRMDCAISGIEPGEDETEMKTLKIRLDGITYEIQVPEALAENFEAAIAELQSVRADSSETKGGLVATKAALAELQARFDAATAPAVIEQAVKERSDVIAKAKALFVEVRTDGLTLNEIRVEALVGSGIPRETFDGRDDSFVLGAFVAAQPKVSTKKDVPSAVPTHRVDASDSNIETASDARQRMIQRAESAWQNTEA